MHANLAAAALPFPRRASRGDDAARLVIHSAASYIEAPVDWMWPFRDSQTSPWFILLLAFIHLFRMPVFFVMAGFFAALLYDRDGPARLVRNRGKRVLLPLVDFLADRHAAHRFFGFIFAAAQVGGPTASARHQPRPEGHDTRERDERGHPRYLLRCRAIPTIRAADAHATSATSGVVAHARTIATMRATIGRITADCTGSVMRRSSRGAPSLSAQDRSRAAQRRSLL